MRIIARKNLTEFAANNPQASASLEHWELIAKHADWKSTSDVQSSFSKAKVINSERVRFEIAGGAFRLIVSFDFERQVAFIKFVGTHALYDKIDAATVSLF